MKSHGFVLSLLAFSTNVDNAGAAPVAGEKLPDIQLTTSSGKVRRAWKPNRITVISFCAFWCDTWKDQSKRLDSSRKALQGLPIDWTMISVDGRWSDKSHDGKWSDIAHEALLDTGSRRTHQLDVVSVPYTLVVNGKGKIIFATQGIAREAQLRPAIRAGLAPTPAQAGTIHLAFDDFPSRNTKLDDALLDILRNRGLKVSFYGSKQRQNSSPAIVARAKQEGHTVNETFDYSRKGIVDPFDFKLVGENELMRRITGSLSVGKTLVLRAGVQESVNVLPRLLDSIKSRSLLVRPT
jgi:hypothetical protein